MFCPNGPAAVATPGNPATISLSGVDRDGAVLYINAKAGFQTDIAFAGSSSFSIHTQEAFFRIPASATGISISSTGSGAQADAVLGQEV